MAAENSFHYRLNDTENAGGLAMIKRKRFDPPIQLLCSEGRARESELLGPFDKGMKRARWMSSVSDSPARPLLSKPVQPQRRVAFSLMEQRNGEPPRRNVLDGISRQVEHAHVYRGFSQANNSGMLGASTKVLGSPKDAATIPGFPSSDGDDVKFRFIENVSDFFKPAPPHCSAGNAVFPEFLGRVYMRRTKGTGEHSENVNRALARELKGEESIERYNELMTRPTLSNAVHGMMNSTFRQTLFESKNDDGSQASLPDADEHSVGKKQPEWQRLFSVANEKNDILRAREEEIECLSALFQDLGKSRPKFEKKPAEDPSLIDAFTPLPSEAERRVDEVLRGDRRDVLVLHERSNIEVTTEVIQCLLPRAWLNDEVINVYMELLKERETRVPGRFLKCHFFNTFFYNKLYKDKTAYDYKAIRRWTTSRRLGYSLRDCDKILVPIHQKIHWCLAVINIRDRKLEYLDSLKGSDRDVLKVLARYISDEAKDKSGNDLDTSNWTLEYPHSIPEQENGCDCGMFMLKYADFHSRDAPLQFTQEHMPYFRKRMVWEIINLEAT